MTTQERALMKLALQPFCDEMQTLLRSRKIPLSAAGVFTDSLVYKILDHIEQTTRELDVIGEHRSPLDGSDG